MSDTDYAYIGKKPCGCVVAAVLDSPEHKESTAKNVAEFISDGLTVERVTVEYVRANLRRCKCGQAEQPALIAAEVSA